MTQIIGESMLHVQGDMDADLQKACAIVEDLIRSSKNETWYAHLSALMEHVNWLYPHSINTALISGVIGNRLGYSEQRMKDLIVGALLHDVGQTALPKQLLNKPSELTEAEMRAVKKHCELGASILEDLPVSNICKTIVLQHHEKKDGSGYPYGLAGVQILQESEIVAIAEAFDTATTARPYKEAKPAKIALQEMFERPELYDAEFVRILMNAIEPTP